VAHGQAQAVGSVAARTAPTFYASGFWRRAAGFGIDAAIILPVGLLLTWMAGAISGLDVPASRFRGLDFWLDLLLTSDPVTWGAIGLLAAIAVVYLLVFQVILGQTPGMRVVGARVIDVYGEAPSYGRAAARTAGYLACFATLGLGFLWAGFDAERRGLHDWISGTYVVRVRPPAVRKGPASVDKASEKGDS